MKRRKFLGFSVAGVSIPVLSGRLYGMPGSIHSSLQPNHGKSDLLHLSLQSTSMPQSSYNAVMPYLQLVKDTLSDDANSAQLIRSPSRYLVAQGVDEQMLPEESAEIRLLSAIADKNIRSLVEKGDFRGFMEELDDRGIFIRRRMSGLETQLRDHLIEHYSEYQQFMELESLNHEEMTSDRVTRDLVSRFGTEQEPMFVFNVALFVNVVVGVNLAVVLAVAVQAAAAVEVEVSVSGQDYQIRSNGEALLNLVELDPDYKRQASEAATLAMAMGNHELAEHISFILFEDLAESYVDTVVDVFEPGWAQDDITAIKSLMVRSLGQSAGIC